MKEIPSWVSEICSGNETRPEGWMPGHPRQRQYPRPNFIGRGMKIEGDIWSYEN